MGKGEIARNKQFLLFPQCFLPVWRIFFLFHQIWNSRLQDLSLWKSLKDNKQLIFQWNNWKHSAKGRRCFSLQSTCIQKIPGFARLIKEFASSIVYHFPQPQLPRLRHIAFALSVHLFIYLQVLLILIHQTKWLNALSRKKTGLHVKFALFSEGFHFKI